MEKKIEKGDTVKVKSNVAHYADMVGVVSGFASNGGVYVKFNGRRSDSHLMFAGEIERK